MENQSCPNCRSSNIHYNVNNLVDGECQDCKYYGYETHFNPSTWPIVIPTAYKDELNTDSIIKRINATEEFKQWYKSTFMMSNNYGQHGVYDMEKCWLKAKGFKV